MVIIANAGSNCKKGYGLVSNGSTGQLKEYIFMEVDPAQFDLSSQKQYNRFIYFLPVEGNKENCKHNKNWHDMYQLR